MIVGGTRFARRRYQGAPRYFDSALSLPQSESTPSTRGNFPSPTRGTPQMKPEHGLVSVSSIPFLEPALRRALFINPMLGSVLHLHQITFALSILMTPQTQKNIAIAGDWVAERTGFYPGMSDAEYIEYQFEKETGLELVY